MNIMKTFSFALGVLITVLFTAGCGNSEPDLLTKTAFIKQGNSICRQAEEDRGAAMKETAEESADGSDESPDEELERFVNDAALPPIQTMIEELDDLGIPRKDEKQVEAIIAGFEDGIEQTQEDPPAAFTGAPFVDANKRAAAYGLTYCNI